MLIQLHPDLKGHWQLYELFEKRCMAFGEKSGWPLNTYHRQEMRERFVRTPQMAGYFVTDALDAHLLSWVLVNYGQVGIIVFQCEGERGEIKPLMANFFESALPSWKNTVEIALKRPVEFIELNIDAELEGAWTRVLERHNKVSAARTMRTLRLTEQASNALSNGAVR